VVPESQSTYSAASGVAAHGSLAHHHEVKSDSSLIATPDFKYKRKLKLTLFLLICSNIGCAKDYYCNLHCLVDELQERQ
jgi:hypothetical protein